MLHVSPKEGVKVIAGIGSKIIKMLKKTEITDRHWSAETEETNDKPYRIDSDPGNHFIWVVSGDFQWGRREEALSLTLSLLVFQQGMGRQEDGRKQDFSSLKLGLVSGKLGLSPERVRF